jgi:hypothetical protein
MAKELFEYTPFIKYKGEVTEENGKRQYESVCGLKCASTTTVLSQYEDLTNDKGEDILEVWGNKMRRLGEDPDEISAESARVGTMAHSFVENYLLWGEYPLGTNAENKLACKAIDNFYSYVDPEYAQCEQPLFLNGELLKPPENFRIAGRYDNLILLPEGVFQEVKTGRVLESQYMICDLKTKRSYEKNKNGSVKLKSLGRTDQCDFMFKNCLQISLYSAILSLQTDFKERYGAGVTGAILVYTNEEKSKLMYLNRSDLNYYYKLFKNILRDYYGLSPLKQSWKQMIAFSNGRWDENSGCYINNIPKEIQLIPR